LTVDVNKNEVLLNNKFELLQNYPNPFNPTTTIKYSIPSATVASPNSNINVVLKVYDILGREILTLVNREQKPGYYQVSFDASNLASGVYYYQLNANNLIQTKKMILIK
jgi:hypothetical protein